jgi:predicted nucleic acid-binding protein
MRVVTAMRFWDTSALVSLLQAEERTEHADGWIREDPVVVAWRLTSTEALSAIERRRRLGDATEEQAARARGLLSKLWTAVNVVEDVGSAQQRAARLLRVHPLRAADALQLAAALAWAEDRPDGHVFLTFDARLGEAASKEGFTVLPVRR